MSAIFRREMNSYLNSSLGLIFLAAFYFFAGLFFVFSTLASQTTELSYIFGSMSTVMMILVPIITMRLMSEDRKNKTDQALLTAPVSLSGIVLGKYFAAFLMYFLGMLITIVDYLVLAAIGTPDFGMFLSNFVGLVLYSASFIAIGMFISTLTESQVVAAIGSIVIFLFLTFIDGIASSINFPLITKILNSISFSARYHGFTVGYINVSDIVFFISVIIMFIFLTIKTLERRRWS